MPIAQDLRYAFRMIGKNRGFAALTILTLSLGIGINTAMFSVLEAVLLRPLPFANPDRLVMTFQTSPADAKQPMTLSALDLLRTESRSLTAVAVYYKNTGFSRVTLTGPPEPESAQGGFVSANFFSLLGVPPQLGRPFTLDEETQRERVVVLSDSLWHRRFGGDPGIIGRTLEIDGASFHVVGIMPANFRFPARETQFWAPITTNRYWLDRPARGSLHTRGFYARWNAVARLKPGITIEQAQAEADVLGRRIERLDPDLNSGLGLTVAPLRIEIGNNTRLALFLLIGAVAFVLLIACANVAHLTLARGASRNRELAVRVALGASRLRLMKQLLAESVLLALLSCAGGVFLATAILRVLIAYGPPDLPRLEEASPNLLVLLFALAASLVSTVLFGLIPAWRISRVSPSESLTSGSRSSVGTLALSRTRRLLVSVEFALTVVLLSGAGLLIRSLLAIEAVDPGFDPERVLTLRMSLPAGAQYTEFYKHVLERVRTVPGVQAVGAINRPFELSGSSTVGSGDLNAAGQLRVWATWKTIGGDYFRAMGTPLLRGRFFTSQDDANAPLVAIVDESMARKYWPGEDALGKQFRGQDARGRNDDPLTVIGVVQDTRSHGREAQSTAHVFQPISQSPDPTPDLIVRTAVEPMKLASTVREIVRSVDRTAIVAGVTTMEQQLGGQISSRRFQTWLLSASSALALALAVVGIYAVMHYWVSQRTHEIGIRMALGARAADVWAMVLRQGMAPALLGLVAGLVCAWWLTQLMAGILYGVTPADPTTYFTVAALLIVVATAAISIPARRAAKTDPMEALRQE